ncbi:unnamed protein product [Schistocephalus solidus]|uniref:Endo/exonuclease/phosphatase domain-containing protein n=1 Tax=Schistocephalus solidus TaxID=70667 RepID=A0A183SBW7_SCHSO|nr:unnamed protein product [Schistocephalus solidus]
MADIHIPLRDVEVLSITISAKYSRPLTISVVYRSPYQTSDQDLILITELYKASEKKAVLIVGDFNAPDIDWKTWTAPGMPDNFNHKLLQWAIDKLLFQNVTYGTLMREGQQSNCLDLIFTRDEDNMLDLQDRSPFGSSDHITLCFV